MLLLWEYLSYLVKKCIFKEKNKKNFWVHLTGCEIKDDYKKPLQVICQFEMYLLMKDWYNNVSQKICFL